MHAQNYSPLANPLNDRQCSNIDHGALANGCYFKHNRNATLPDSTFSYQDFKDYQDSLHVSNQGPKGPFSVPFANGILDLTNYAPSWNDSNIDSRYSAYQQNRMSQEEILRINYLKQKDAELSANMNADQKQMLNDIEKYLGKSKLVDED